MAETENDMQLLKDAQDAVFTLSKAYKTAFNNSDLDTMGQLKPKLDAAVDALNKAREKLIADDVDVTADDVAEMQRIKSAIDRAAQTQELIQGAVQLVGLLTKFL